MAVVSSERFLLGVKRRVTIPNNQQLITDSDILSLADDCMRSEFFPMMQSAGQNYFVYFKKIAVVAGQESYSVPSRCAVQGLRDLKIGVDTSDTSTRSLTEIAIENLDKYALDGTPQGYYFLGNKITLKPRPNASDYALHLWFFSVPSRLIATSEAGVLISGAANTLTCSYLPTTIVVGSKIDVIEASAGNSTIAFDLTVTNVVGTNVTVAESLTGLGITMGDFLSLSETTPVLQIPTEGLSLLEAMTARRVLEAVGDFEGAQVLESREGDLTKSFLKMIQSRNKGAVNKIVPRMDGLLRGRSRAINRSFW